MYFKRELTPKSSETGWYSRGFLPRFDIPGVTQSITFRLFDSVPQQKVKDWKLELGVYNHIAQDDPRAVELRRRIAKFEDSGYGCCWLKLPQIAKLVEDNLLYFDGSRYNLLAWCVMANHVHVMVDILPDFNLSDISHSWKSFTAKQINKIVGRSGEVWEREGCDRYIRNENHYNNVVRYIENNPVEAGLVAQSKDWLYSSARRR